MLSSPSTPRTARSASPSEGGSPEILTPGKKIKAMLAAFDSDSESDNNENYKPRNSTSKSNLGLQLQNITRQTTGDSDGDEDEEEIVVPKGRMAARMQGQIQTDGGDGHASFGIKTGETAFERLSRNLREGNKQEENDAISSDDELPTAGPRRRLMKAKNRSLEENYGDDSDQSPSPARSFSPLFMSSPIARQRDEESQSQMHIDNGGSDNDEQEQPRPEANARFLALVAQKRKEREEKERMEAEKRKAARATQMEQFSSEILSGGESDDDDGTSGRKLTQHSRPTRKASKKALEEMNRETQRMSRNMQLAHQAKTKKKITKESFFARFNFMQPQESAAAEPSHENSSITGSQHSSDGEAGKDKETPHTSPVLGPLDKTPARDGMNAHTETFREENNGAELEDLPSFEEMLAAPRPPPPEESIVLAATETRTLEPHTERSKPKNERKQLTKPPVRVLLSRESVAQHQKDDSDDDLEVVTSPAKCRRIAAFENLPARKMQESSSLLKLKALAHLTSPTRRSASMTPAELSAMLLYQARQQAVKERQERIQELRAKGIIIETAEERAAMEDDVEDLMEKARKEAEEIARREKKASKKDAQEGEEKEEDADYEMSDSDEEGNNGEGEDDEEDEDEDEDEDGVNDEKQGLIEAEAGEDEESEDEQTEIMSSDGETEMPVPRRKRQTRVISDDEDDEQEPKTPAKPTTAPTVLSIEKPQLPPGLDASNDMTMSLTQAFAGTLAGSQAADLQESSVILPSLPDPGRAATEGRELDSQILVRDSQEVPAETPDILAGYSQYESRESESPALRYSQIPDPTQDVGFVLSPFDPLKRFNSTPGPSTIETVLLPRNESPIPKRKGRHLRRGRVAELSDVEEEDGFEIKASAFDVMKKATKKKPAVQFDRTKSKAKEVVEEAAEESDDEYAGLGGASDYSEDDEDEYDKEMINDNSGEVVDEKELAALNAVHQRAADEKQVAKLLKDITTGALRRRRGADDDFDLDDSDDERIARRRAKQREFARMRKALLADEKVGELADNPKKAAFFRAIEDRDMDDDFDFDFLNEEEEKAASGSQQDSSPQDVVPESQNQGPPGGESHDNNNKRKRPLEPSTEAIANRPPPHLRRTRPSAMSKRPTTLAEIRETLSFLTERPEYDSFHEDASMDVDEDVPDNDNSNNVEDTDTDAPHEDESATSRRSSKDGFTVPMHPRRTRGPVVDRLALLRQASSNSASASASASTTRLAFYSATDIDVTASVGFRPPPFIRRAATAATNSSSSSSSGVSVSTTSRVPKPSAGPSLAKKGAVNYYTAAREREREREIRVKQRTGPSNIAALLSKRAGGLGALGGKGQWD